LLHHQALPLACPFIDHHKQVLDLVRAPHRPDKAAVVRQLAEQGGGTSGAAAVKQMRS
jgi:hypothetical protein